MAAHNTLSVHTGHRVPRVPHRPCSHRGARTCEREPRYCCSVICVDLAFRGLVQHTMFVMWSVSRNDTPSSHHAHATCTHSPVYTSVETQEEANTGTKGHTQGHRNTGTHTGRRGKGRHHMGGGTALPEAIRRIANGATTGHSAHRCEHRNTHTRPHEWVWHNHTTDQSRCTETMAGTHSELKSPQMTQKKHTRMHTYTRNTHGVT